jgi:hypothetical protein
VSSQPNPVAAPKNGVICFPRRPDCAKIDTNRSLSLLDIMNRIELGALTHELGEISALATVLIAVKIGFEDTGVRETAVKRVNTLKTILSFLEFPDSTRTIEESIPWILNPICDASSVGTRLQYISECVMAEARKQRFLYVLPDRVEYIENPTILGDLVLYAFPDAEQDIQEAGDCLAAECNTAAVFHLMRVVEHGLRALCVDLGLKRVRSKVRKSGRVVYSPIEYLEWEKLLDGLQTRVDEKITRLKRGPKKQELQEFYYPVLQDIRAIRDAWRNHVMHTRAFYTREDAVAILSHVKRLMCSLAESPIQKRPNNDSE